MNNKILSNIDYFEIKLMLYPRKILNRKITPTYQYIIGRKENEEIFYYIDTKKMFIFCKLEWGIENILTILEQVFRIIEITKKIDADGEFCILDKNKNEYEIYFKLGQRYNIPGIPPITSPTLIDIKFKNENIIGIHIEETDLLKVYEILRKIIDKKMFLDDKLNIEEIKKSILTYFETGVWKNRDIKTTIIAHRGKPKNIKINNEIVRYYMKYFIGINYKKMPDIKEILFTTDYGYSHISYEGFPELIDYSLNYLQHFFGLTEESSKRNRYSREFSYDNKEYCIIHKRNQYVTIKRLDNFAKILHFSYHLKDDISDRISFIRKFLKNKDIILDLFNKENSNFINLLMQMLDRFSYKLYAI
jgi:hypothetical protein